MTDWWTIFSDSVVENLLKLHFTSQLLKRPERSLIINLKFISMSFLSAFVSINTFMTCVKETFQTFTRTGGSSPFFLFSIFKNSCEKTPTNHFRKWELPASKHGCHPLPVWPLMTQQWECYSLLWQHVFVSLAFIMQQIVTMTSLNSCAWMTGHMQQW